MSEQPSGTPNKQRCYLKLLQIAFNGLYKIAFLAALVWIGFGLQSIAAAIDSNTDTCVVQPDTGDAGQQDEQPELIKPLMRNTM